MSTATPTDLVPSLPRRKYGILDLPWHPAVFSLTVVLDYWVRTAVSPYAAVRAAIFALGISVGLVGVAWVLTRNVPKAAVIATAIIALLYSKPLVDLLGDVGSRSPLVTVAWVTMVVLAAAFGMRVVRRRTSPWSMARTNQVLNLLGLVYLATTLVLAVSAGRVGMVVRDLDQGNSLEEAIQSAGPSAVPSEVPDIYVILLDGYPRADVLMEAFGIDNSPFLSELEERGFDVATASTTPYLWTQHSLTSMLHMAPVEEIPRFQAAIDGTESRHPTLRDLVNYNPSFEIARDAGYEVIATGYEFDQVALRQADVYLDPGYLNEFEINLLTATFLGGVVSAVAPDFASAQHRSWIEFQTTALPRIAASATDRPRLVFGHIPAPHQPAVFGPNGEPRTVALNEHFFADSPTERGESADAFARRYRDQLAHLNEVYLEMVDGILSGSATPPVIVLWGDHGSASQVDWNVTQPGDADPNALRERTSTLFASLTPDGSAPFPDDIRPFDIVRVLADAYFGTDLGRSGNAP